MYCKYCGNEMIQGEKFCTQCGKSMNQDEMDTFVAEEGNINQNHGSKAGYGVASTPNLEQQTSCKELLFSKKKMYGSITYKTTKTTLYLYPDLVKFQQSVKKAFAKEKVVEKCIKLEEIQTVGVRTVLDFWDTLCGGILVLGELILLFQGNFGEAFVITLLALLFLWCGYGKEIDILISDGSKLKIPFGNREGNAEDLFMFIGYDKVTEKKSKKGIIVGCVAIVIAMMILFLILAVSSVESNIERVKGSYFNFYSSTITAGDALENFCESPDWDEYDAGGIEYVKFSGTIKGQADVLQVLFKVTDQEVKIDSVQVNGKLYDTGLMMYGIYNMNYEGINAEVRISENETEGNSVVAESSEDFSVEEKMMDQNYVQWEGNYVRTNGPAAFISVWSSEEDGVLFAVSVGVSGYAAYIDMRDLVGEWEDVDVAVYSDESGYRLSLTKLDDDSLFVSENQEYYDSGLNLSGTYVREELADPSICEFVFPESNNSYLSEDDCMGLTALECRIARNEIYARYGRKFSDESLQAYFDSCLWYQGAIEPAEFSEEFLNEVELSNLDTITSYEASQGF